MGLVLHPHRSHDSPCLSWDLLELSLGIAEASELDYNVLLWRTYSSHYAFLLPSASRVIKVIHSSFLTGLSLITVGVHPNAGNPWHEVATHPDGLKT